MDFPAWAAASSDKRTWLISEDWEGRCRVQAGGEVRKRKKAWVTSKEETRLQIHAPGRDPWQETGVQRHAARRR